MKKRRLRGEQRKARDAEVVEAAKSGGPLSDLAKKFDLHPLYIGRILARAGAPRGWARFNDARRASEIARLRELAPHGAGARMYKVASDRAEIDAMLSDGLTQSDVARHIGVSHQAISAYLKRKRLRQ